MPRKHPTSVEARRKKAAYDKARRATKAAYDRKRYARTKELRIAGDSFEIRRYAQKLEHNKLRYHVRTKTAKASEAARAAKVAAAAAARAEAAASAAIAAANAATMLRNTTTRQR